MQQENESKNRSIYLTKQWHGREQQKKLLNQTLPHLLRQPISILRYPGIPCVSKHRTAAVAGVSGEKISRARAFSSVTDTEDSGHLARTVCSVSGSCFLCA
ncbi:hypothetical protein JTE90_016218 [Oedothorax gibbosus]|uniref:Uncharacterized protein n=1 Tax=Oedothorax gibbosus TaxID=931172 RepID=A0AAV6U9Q2_9ARAC|nr:hypothetical protein JTE90_016218 [Oedothorax gibbosus]